MIGEYFFVLTQRLFKGATTRNVWRLAEWLTITKELSLNAKKRLLPRINLNRLSFVTLFREKYFVIIERQNHQKHLRFAALASK
jgi:hypothetical protein